MLLQRQSLTSFQKHSDAQPVSEQQPPWKPKSLQIPILWTVPLFWWHLCWVTVLEVKHGKTTKGRSIFTQVGAVTEPWKTDTTFLWWQWHWRHIQSLDRIKKGGQGAVVLEARRGSLSPGGGKNDGSNPPHLLPWWWDTWWGQQKSQTRVIPPESVPVCHLPPLPTARVAASHLKPKPSDFLWSHQPHNCNCTLHLVY